MEILTYAPVSEIRCPLDFVFWNNGLSGTRAVKEGKIL